MAAMRETLPDYLASDLRVLSIGLNPSLPAVRAGFYFANPRNRFWRAFADSGLAASAGAPSAAYHRTLLQRDRIGFTDVVKRPSRQGCELRAADFRRDAPRLLQRLQDCRPQWAWFHGKQAYRNFLHYALDATPKHIRWGVQRRVLGPTRIFVVPNPSPANAAYSLADLQHWHRRLARHVHA